jgi:hypothetical protein
MRRILVAVSLLGAGALLGTAGFGGAIAGAATPFTNVIIGNTSDNPVPVTGTVSLGSTDANNLDGAATHLSRIDTAASKLGFDGSGNLRPVRQHPGLLLEPDALQARSLGVGNDRPAVRNERGARAAGPSLSLEQCRWS